MKKAVCLRAGRDMLLACLMVLVQVTTVGAEPSGALTVRTFMVALLAPADPPQLFCQYILVAPSNLYAHVAYPGGALRKNLTENYLRGHARAEEYDEVRRHPRYDDYWMAGDATAVAQRVWSLQRDIGSGFRSRAPTRPAGSPVPRVPRGPINVTRRTPSRWEASTVLI